MAPETSLALQLVEVFTKGGPWAVTIVFIWLYMREKDYTQKLHEKIVTMVEAGTKSAVEHTNALAAMKEVLARLVS